MKFTSIYDSRSTIHAFLGRGCRRRRRWGGPRRRSGYLHGLLSFLSFGSRMTFESPRRREFTQLMAHHVFGHVNRNMPFAVMNPKRQAHHVGRNSRAARPGANHLRLLRAGANSLDNLLDALIYPGA